MRKRTPGVRVCDGRLALSLRLTTTASTDHVAVLSASAAAQAHPQIIAQLHVPLTQRAHLRGAALSPCQTPDAGPRASYISSPKHNSSEAAARSAATDELASYPRA